MTFEPHDWFLIAAGASVVGALTVALVGAYLFRHYKRARVVSGIQAEFNGLSPDRDYGRVRERNPAVRMSTVHDRKTEEQYEQIRHASLAQDRAPGFDASSLSASPTTAARRILAPEVEQGRAVQEAPTNLVPFERGYAFTGFSKRVH